MPDQSEIEPKRTTVGSLAKTVGGLAATHGLTELGRQYVMDRLRWHRIWQQVAADTEALNRAVAEGRSHVPEFSVRDLETIKHLSDPRQFNVTDKMKEIIKQAPMSVGRMALVMPLMHGLGFGLGTLKDTVFDPRTSPIEHGRRRLERLADSYDQTRNIEGGVKGSLVNAGKSWMFNPIGSAAWHLRDKPDGTMGGEATA